MVIAYHLIMTAYGFWLPNDPRGSWSTWVRSWELLRFGGPTKVNTRQSLANRPHGRLKRAAAAKEALKYQPVELDSEQIQSVAGGFARAIDEAPYAVHACSIMDDHAHLVVARTGRTIEQIASHLKARESQQLRKEGLHPMEAHVKPDGSVPTVWARGLWKVFIDSERQFENAVRYVEDNPLREGRPRQDWPFVVENEGRGKPRG